MENFYGYTKLQLILELLSYLYVSNYYVKNEQIAERLGINERGVRRLVEQLRELGYEVDAKKGRDGGYKLLKHNLFLPVLIDEDYRQAFQDIQAHCRGNSNLPNYEKCMSLLDILGTKSQLEISSTYQVFEGFSLLPEVKEQIEKVYQILQKAIKNRTRVKIKYKNSQGKVMEIKEFDPYQFQIYKNAYYVKGYYHNKPEQVRTLKLSRFIDVIPSNKKFVQEEDFWKKKEEKPFSSNIFTKHSMKLKIHQNRNDLKDFQYGENQIITDLDKEYFLLECDMYGDYVIINFILSLGKDCEVLEPLEIREKVKDQIQLMSQYY